EITRLIAQIRTFMLIFYIKYGIRSYLMKYKRSERLVFMTRHLTAHPNQLIPLTFFVEKFNQAKSSISEDIRIIKEVFENDGIGIVQTTAGAGGRVTFQPRSGYSRAGEIVEEWVGMLNTKERLLPGRYLYMSDNMKNPTLMYIIGELIATRYGFEV